MHFSTLALPILGLASQALAATYSLSSNVVGNDFYNDFSFEAIGDPTGGRVSVLFFSLSFHVTEEYRLQYLRR